MKRAALQLAIALASAAIGALGLSACNGGASAPRPNSDAPPVSTGASVRPAVAWPAQNAVDSGAFVLLSKTTGMPDAELRSMIARSAVPVLVPAGVGLAAATLMVEGEYFALAGHVDDRGGRATISVQGTRTAHRYEGIEPRAGNRPLRASGAILGFVSINENIRTASWIEHGAAYNVDVECSDVRDGRCQSDDFLLSIVADLAYVGGSGR